MNRAAPTEMLLIRHAPSMDGGALAGRRDVDADCSNMAALDAVRIRLGAVDHLVVSPAARCAQTADALKLNLPRRADPRLWEQDFGQWEGRQYADLPNLGTLTTAQLAAHCPPDGESFDDLCARAIPALDACAALGGRVAIVAHAGIIRAALGLALGHSAAGLAFQIAPLSLTTILALGNGQFAIKSVNWTAL